MHFEIITDESTRIAVASGSKAEIADTQSALELAMRAKYEAAAEKLLIDKRILSDAFFILSTELAGEILQKFTNYHIKAAIFGDYTRYTSKPLRDFIYETNQGTQFFFAATREEGIQRLKALP